MQALHQTSIEEIIIRTILINGDAIAMATRHLSPEMFREPRLSVIYSQAEKLFHKGTELDMLTLKKALSESGRLAECGGLAYIMQLINNVTVETNIEGYIQALKKEYLRRKLATALNKLSTEAQNDQRNLENLLAETHRLTEDIENAYLANDRLRPLPELMKQSLNKLEKRRASHFLTGIPTGVQELDRLTMGWQPGQLIVVTSKLSTDKTTLGLHMAQEAAKAGHKVVVYSTELPGEQLADRMLATESALPANREKPVSQEKMKQAYAVARNLSYLPLLIDDSARISMSHIRTSALIRQSKGICDFIVVDSLSLCDTPADNLPPRRKQETDDLLRQAKILAMEFKLPVLLISQLTKKEQKYAERYADTVILLQRPPSDRNDGSLTITKNRNGQIKEILFSY